MDSKNFDLFHQRCEKLTGDRWCPYPSDLFIFTVNSVTDEKAKSLIEKRRTFLLPQFLAGEPMLKELNEINGIQS